MVRYIVHCLNHLINGPHYVVGHFLHATDDFINNPFNRRPDTIENILCFLFQIIPGISPGLLYIFKCSGNAVLNTVHHGANLLVDGVNQAADDILNSFPDGIYKIFDCRPDGGPQILYCSQGRDNDVPNYLNRI